MVMSWVANVLFGSIQNQGGLAAAEASPALPFTRFDLTACQQRLYIV